MSDTNRLQRRPLVKPMQWYEDIIAARKQAMALANASRDFTMKQISEWFCVRYSTVSRAVKLFEVKA